MLDIVIVFAYLILLLIIGILKRQSSNYFRSFSKITTQMQGNKLIIVAAIFASAIGGGTTFGIAEKAFAGNIAYSYGLMLAIPVDIIIAIFVLPKLVQHYGAESVGDIMSKYYGSSGRYIGGFSAILVSIGLLAAQISVSGRIFEYILQIDYISGIIFSYGIIVIYTTIGGFQSIIFTNQLQFFAIILAIPVISFVGLYHMGIDNFLMSVPVEKFSFSNNSNLINTTISAALGFSVINLLPTFIQRVLINPNSGTTKTAIYIKSVIYAVFLIFITINGLLAYIQYPEIKASIALPHLIDRIMPAGVQGLIVVGLLAAVMSTADADLNVTSVTLVKDFFTPLFKIEKQETMLIIARLTNIVMGSFAIIIALCFSRVVDLVIFIAGFWGPVILVPMLFGLFGIVTTRLGFILACVMGSCSFLVWSLFFQTDTGLKGVFIGTVTNLIVFLISFVLSKKFNKSGTKWQ